MSNFKIIKPEDISNIFNNINHKPCKVPCYDLAFDVMEKDRFFGELFYSKTFAQWLLIKDNFPAPRRSYEISFPVDVEMFTKLFMAVGVELELSKTENE